METGVTVALLGGFEARLNGQLVEGFESDKARALLAYLAIEIEGAHRREKLAGLFWPEVPEKRARHNLSQVLYNLRSILVDKTSDSHSVKDESIFIVSHQAIWLEPRAMIDTDVLELRTGLEGCAAHAPNTSQRCPDCIESILDVVELYKGELLAGFSLPGCPEFESWLILERERSHRSMLTAYETLTTWHRRKGEHRKAQRYARRAVALDPLWERAHRQMMYSMWLAGDKVEALAQYEICRETLANELGVEPDEQTQKLARRIQSDAEIISPMPEKQRLPSPLTPFIGRKAELAAVQELLTSATCRLLTLVGPGGSGKSRLAIEAARQVIDEFPDGLYLVPLSSIESELSLVPAIAEVVGLPIQEDRDPEQQLFDYLRQKQLLLLMDSYEAVLEGVEVSVSILREAPKVKILATSRAPLKANGEYRFSVEGLMLPDKTASPDAMDFDAVKLFVSAGERSRQGYTPSAENLEAIVRICQAVDGMPLGIILATSWLKMLSPQEIADQIEKSLDFLSVEWADLPQRQRSLRATMQYTWQLLDERGRQLFKTLSIFQGRFTLHAAFQVTGIAHKELLSLLEYSLVQKTSGSRYLVHDLLRQFSAEKLAEDLETHSMVREKHSQYFITQLMSWAPDLKCARQQTTLTELDLDHFNLLAALEYRTQSGGDEWPVEALNGFLHYYELRRRFAEGEKLCRTVYESLQKAELEPGWCIRSLWIQVWWARFSRFMGQMDTALNRLSEAASLLGEVGRESRKKMEVQAFYYLDVGQAHYATDRGQARKAFRESATLYLELEDRWGEANALIGLGGVTRYLDELAESVEIAEKSLALARSTGDPRITARALNGLGQSLNRAGSWEGGEKCILEMISIHEAIENTAGMAISQMNLARTYIWFGRFEDSLELLNQCHPILHDLGYQGDALFTISLIGAMCWFLGRYEEAAIRSESLLSLMNELDYPRILGVAYLNLGASAVGLHDYLAGQRHAQQATAVFSKLANLDDLALALGLRASSEIKRGELQAAKKTLVESLEIVSSVRGIWGASHTLPIAALYLSTVGQFERAIEVYTLIERYPIAANAVFYQEVARAPVYQAAASLPPDTISAAEERGRGGDPFQMAAELMGMLKA